MPTRCSRSSAPARRSRTLPEQNSTDAVIAEAGGIVRGGTNGDQECLEPATVNPRSSQRSQDAPVGQPIAADLDTFSAVLMLRPFDELLPESQSLIASASRVAGSTRRHRRRADVYVDPRYGRWDPASGSVVTLTS